MSLKIDDVIDIIEKRRNKAKKEGHEESAFVYDDCLQLLKKI